MSPLFCQIFFPLPPPPCFLLFLPFIPSLILHLSRHLTGPGKWLTAIPADVEEESRLDVRLGLFHCLILVRVFPSLFVKNAMMLSFNRLSSLFRLRFNIYKRYSTAFDSSHHFSILHPPTPTTAHLPPASLLLDLAVRFSLTSFSSTPISC